jgi:hypothetical protein
MLENASHFYGLSSEKNQKWAYNLSKTVDYVAYKNDVAGQCNANLRALYCVQQ